MQLGPTDRITGPVQGGILATTMVLGHGLRLHTALQAVLDFGFVFVGVIVAALWLGSGLPVNIVNVVI